jgi:hypothetical protein
MVDPNIAAIVKIEVEYPKRSPIDKAFDDIKVHEEVITGGASGSKP